jgi:hypothetical protein
LELRQQGLSFRQIAPELRLGEGTFTDGRGC